LDDFACEDSVYTEIVLISVASVESLAIHDRAHVPVFDAHGATGGGDKRGVLTRALLDAGFLIGAEHKVVRAQGFAGPAAFVEVENPSGLVRKVWVAWKDPASISPRTQRVLTEPAPNGCASDGSHDAAAAALALPPSRRRQLDAVIHRCYSALEVACDADNETTNQHHDR